MKKIVSNALAADLLNILHNASQQKGMPLKFCIAKNINILTDRVKEYTDRKDELFKAAVKIDQNGEAVMNAGVDKEKLNMQGIIPYTAFEYNSSEAQADFMGKLNELNLEEIEVEFITEKADRRIKILCTDGSYEDSTIQEVLEANDEITPALIRLFIEYFLEV